MATSASLLTAPTSCARCPATPSTRRSCAALSTRLVSVPMDLAATSFTTRTFVVWRRSVSRRVSSRCHLPTPRPHRPPSVAPRPSASMSMFCGILWALLQTLRRRRPLDPRRWVLRYSRTTFKSAACPLHSPRQPAPRLLCLAMPSRSLHPMTFWCPHRRCWHRSMCRRSRLPFSASQHLSEVFLCQHQPAIVTTWTCMHTRRHLIATPGIPECPPPVPLPRAARPSMCPATCVYPSSASCPRVSERRVGWYRLLTAKLCYLQCTTEIPETCTRPSLYITLSSRFCNVSTLQIRDDNVICTLSGVPRSKRRRWSEQNQGKQRPRGTLIFSIFVMSVPICQYHKKFTGLVNGLWSWLSQLLQNVKFPVFISFT